MGPDSRGTSPFFNNKAFETGSFNERSVIWCLVGRYAMGISITRRFHPLIFRRLFSSQSVGRKSGFGFELPSVVPNVPKKEDQSEAAKAA